MNGLKNVISALFLRKMSFRYSRLCGKASDTVGAVRSAIPTGFKFMRNHLCFFIKNQHDMLFKKI